MQKTKNTELIKQKAYELGFTFVGFSKSGFLEEEAPRLEAWLKANAHGEMSYMENYFDKRLNPSLLVEGTKTVVSLMYNYYTELEHEDKNAPKISKYAYGKDYHPLIKNKLRELFLFIQEEIGEVGGRYFVDSAPVLDRAWAKKAGLGWIGKNANLITKQQGSFLFLAEMMLDIELDYNTSPVKNYCGSCTRCIDACPTGAIIKPYVVDGSKCISYFTIELKNAIPVEMKDKFEDWMFGCDICQNVCPWNRFSLQHNEPWFEPHPDLLKLTRSDWEELEQPLFQEVFRKSAVKRTKYSGLKRNIAFLKKN